MYLLFDILMVYLSISFIFCEQINSKNSVECEKETNNCIQECNTNNIQLECKPTANCSHSGPQHIDFKCCAFYQFEECLTKRLDSIKNKECKQLKDSLKFELNRRSLDWLPICLKAGYIQQSEECEQLMKNTEKTIQRISSLNSSSVLEIGSIFLVIIIFKALNLFIH
jgi:hypothetical protein